MIIRPISNEREHESFIDMQHYCFQGPRHSGPFPPKGGVAPWGAFDGDKLCAGLVEVPFQVNLLGSVVGMLGIGGVASLPENRNSGSVRRLHETVLAGAPAKGYTVSSLYPFSFGFYQKFGYGSLGPRHLHRFAPEDLRRSDGSSPYSIATPEPNTLASEISRSWLPEFLGRYDFSDALETERLQDELSRAVSGGGYLRSVVDAGGVSAGFLLYEIGPPVNWNRTFTVKRIAWRDGHAFRTIMDFIWSHRGQCGTVEWSWSDEDLIHRAMVEPRIERITSHDWMARPVDLMGILETRIKDAGFDDELTFSVEDPCIPENTGTYRITSGEVDHSPDVTEQPISFHLLSSMIFGRLSAADLSLQQPLSFDPTVADRLFTRRTVHITEGF